MQQTCSDTSPRRERGGRGEQSPADERERDNAPRGVVHRQKRMSDMSHSAVAATSALGCTAANGGVVTRSREGLPPRRVARLVTAEFERAARSGPELPQRKRSTACCTDINKQRAQTRTDEPRQRKQNLTHPGGTARAAPPPTLPPPPSLPSRRCTPRAGPRRTGG